MDLVIVESPNKCKKIKKILGSNFRVEASVGHVADLPKKELGVDFTNFLPDYVATEQGKKVLANLKKSANDAKVVYLATDPDREGEAIAAHLKHFLKLNNAKRITFNEITPSAIAHALKSSRDIDENLYQAQQARRVIDRLVGYQVSSKLFRIANQNLSAGRVQSVALRLVVDREDEISKFTPTDHFGVKLLLGNNGNSWVAKWDSSEFVTDDFPYVQDKQLVEKVLTVSMVKILKIDTKQSKKHPPPPFITTTLQKAASLTLGISAAQTMSLAQDLFAEGLITYHRTDNPNLSDETMPAIEQTLSQLNLQQHISNKKRTYKAKGNAQEAHEAIRPTDFMKPSIAGDDKKDQLYQLIRNRALASQMKSAQIETTTITAEGDIDLNGTKPKFLAKTQNIIYKG